MTHRSKGGMLKRILSLATALLMLCSLWPLHAGAADNTYMINLIAKRDGMEDRYFAAMPSADTQDVYWVQVDQDALSSALYLEVSHPQMSQYTYYPSSEEMLLDVMNAQGFSDTPVPVSVYDGGTLVTTLMLYVSTSAMPETQTPPPEKRNGFVTVHYVVDGKASQSVQQELAPGTHNLFPDSEWIGESQLVDPKSYEVTISDDGSASPSEVTFNYVTPKPTSAQVTILYQTKDGMQLGSDSRTYDNGIYTVDAPPSISGYELMEPYTQDIEIRDGVATPSDTVVFYYQQPAPTSAQVTILYQTRDGMQLGSDSRTYDNGIYTVDAPPSISGYELMEPYTQDIEIRDGVATPSDTVIFYYQQPAPTSAAVNIYYYLDGDLVDQDSRTYENGEHSISPDVVDAVQGATLTSAGAVTVTVANGVATPADVSFYYETPKAASATVNIYYYLDGDLVYQESKSYENGPHSITPAAVDAVQGAELTSDAAVAVNVDNGVATPADVFFNYTKPVVESPVSGTVEVLYRGDDMVTLDTQTVSNLAVGENIIAAMFTERDGYVLSSPNQQTVTILADGSASPSSIEFVFTAPKSQEPVPVPVRYLGPNGVELAADTVYLGPEDGVYPVTPNSDVVSNHVLTPAGQVVNVQLSGGAATPGVVEFIYAAQTSPEEPPANEINVQVTVTYSDKNGAAVADAQTLTFTEAGQQPVHASPANLKDGYALAASESDTKYVSIADNGTADTNQINFTYALKDQEITAPPPISVMVYHKDGAGANILEPYSVSAPVSQNTVINAQAISGWAQVVGDPASVTVSVSAEGVPSEDVVIFTYEKIPEDTPVEDGQIINRYGTSNTVGVYVRKTPNAKGNVVTQLKNKGSAVFMHITEPNANGEKWTKVWVNGEEGYIRSDLLDMMTQFDSDRYEATQASPPPKMTPAPTEAPTETPTPTPTPSAAPMYTGYALTTQKTALREEASTKDSALKTTLEADTLVVCDYQVTAEGIAWSKVKTLDNTPGFVQDADLRRIDAQQAQPYIDAYEKAKETNTPTPSPTPTASPTPSPVPQQVSGYAITIGDNVPFRGAAAQNSTVKDFLKKDTVVYVIGQEYPDGEAWDAAYYQNNPGYIRHDQLRMLTQAEAIAYEKSLQSTPPTPTYSAAPLDPNSASAYGYVSASTVNFRSGPSTSNSKIKTLSKYAFGMVLGSQTVNGEVWYKVSVGGTQGYILSNHFKVLSLKELEEFLQSPNYNNSDTTSSGGSSGGGSSGGSSSGGSLVSQEDVNIGEWKNNPGLSASYEPFDPFATPGPIEGDEASPSPSASLTPTLEPLETVVPPDYETTETQTGNPLGVIMTILGVALVGGGGAYGYSIYRSNQKKAAARAAQRRAAAQQAQRPTAPGGRPYARPAQMGGQQGPQGTPQQGTPPQGAQRPATGQQIAQGGQRPATPASPGQPGAGTANRAPLNTTAAGAMGAAAAQEAYRRPPQQPQNPAQQGTPAAYQPPRPSQPGQSQPLRPSQPQPPRPAEPGAPARNPYQAPAQPNRADNVDFPQGTQGAAQRRNPRSGRGPQNGGEE